MFRSSTLVLSLAIATLCLVLFTGTSSAALCLGTPSLLKKGASCGAGAPCQTKLYCNNKGICAERLLENQPCNYQDECDLTLTCKGEDGKKTCVRYSKPGETCDPNGAGPYCPYYCDPVSNTCLSGQNGDQCIGTANLTCSFPLQCVDGFCTPAADGAPCQRYYECKGSSYCDKVCRPKKTEGICLSSSYCAPGFACVGLSNFDMPSCIPMNSRKEGEYCTTDSECDGAARCYGNICSSKKVKHCTQTAECGEGEECQCDGGVLQGGVGTCSPSKCSKKQAKVMKCVESNCNTASLQLSQFFLPFACPLLSCADEFDSLVQSCPLSLPL